MMKKAFLILPMAASILVAGCSGNSSSSTVSPAPILEPIVLDKEIGEVEWNENNRLLMASLGYRTVAQNSLMATLYSGLSSSFNTLATLIQQGGTRSCNISGVVETTIKPNTCLDVNNESVVCGEDGAIKTRLGQEAVFYRCQDGINQQGEYLDGPLIVEETKDASIENSLLTVFRYSAIDQIKTYDGTGFVRNDDNDNVYINATDFLFQTEQSSLYLGHEYTVTEDKNIAENRHEELGACTDPDRFVEGTFVEGTEIIRSEIMEADLMASLQQPTPWLEYTEYRNLELRRDISNHRCVESDGESVFVVDDVYEMEVTLASKSMGTNTLMTWTNMRLPATQERLEGTDSLVRKVEGTLTLVHTNPEGSASPTTTIELEFDGLGHVTVNGGTAITVQELLSHSEPEDE